MKDLEIGEAYGVNRRNKKCNQNFFVSNPEGNTTLQGTTSGWKGRIKVDLRKWNVRLSTGLICLRTESSS
jgi:hypothetical protein